jgi:hypothetical protein
MNGIPSLKSHKNPWLYFIILACSCFPINAGAETVVLKSGKSFEGEIIEKTSEYITLESNAGTYKIRFNQMDPGSKARILGQTEEGAHSQVSSSEELMNALPEDLSMQDVQVKMEAYREYFKQVDDLLWNYRNIMFRSTKSINQAVGAKNYSRGGQAADQTWQQIRNLEKLLAKLAPPPELKNYNQRVSDVFRYTIKSIDAWSYGDQQTYYRYHRSASKAFLASMEERKKFSEFVGMLAAMLDQMDATIQYFQKQIDSSYY